MQLRPLLFSPGAGVMSACPPAATRSYMHVINQEFLVEKEGLKAKVFDGKKLADTINKEVAAEIEQMLSEGKR